MLQWTTYRLIAKTLMTTTYVEAELIKLHIARNSFASSTSRVHAITQESKDASSLFKKDKNYSND